jgi:hypothetical protein
VIHHRHKSEWFLDAHRNTHGPGKERRDADGPALEDAFLIPSDNGWKSHEEKKNGDRTLILERVMAAARDILPKEMPDATHSPDD